MKREEIASAYLFNFAKNIEWQNERSLSEYHFLILSDDNNLNQEMLNHSKNKKLNGKPIRVTLSESILLPKDIQLVFIARSLNDLAHLVFHRIEGQNTLLVTDGLEDKRIAMINLFETKDKTIRFELNLANIINQGLKVRPEMVLLGGTEIDVAKLYKESQDTLRIREGKIASLRQRLDSLNTQIKFTRMEIEKQNRVIAQHFDSILEQKRRLEMQQAQLEKQQSLLSQRQVLLGKQRDTLGQLHASLQESQRILKQQQLEIERGQSVLTVQKAKIDEQNASILGQKKVLEERDIIIASQRSTQRLLILILILAFGLSYSVYRSYRSNKRSNKLLQDQKDKLEDMLIQLESARDKARQYLDIAGVLIVAIDINRRVTLINQKGCEILGHSLGEIIGKDWFETYVPVRDRGDLALLFHQMIRGETEAPEHLESLVHTHEKGERLIAWHTALLRDANGDITGTLSSGEDITEKKRIEAEIAKLNQDLLERANDLESANKELEAFSYSVSHDLRAPLRSIDGFSQAVLEDYEDKVDETGKDYLRRIRAAAQRMAHLIDDMLNLSRVTRGEMVLREIDLSRMAADIAERLRKQLPERKMELIIQPNIFVLGDEHLLRIALENLFDNACKYTSKHAAARIEFGLHKLGNRQVWFIKDDGAGFDMKYAQKLFGAFQRMHTEKEFPGTGVGLATVQRIIHRHGGEIWAESEVEKGATFYCSLPIKE